MKNYNAYCSYYQYFSQNRSEHQMTVFACISSILSILTCLVNTVAVVVIKKTGQLSNQSVHLTYVICIMDIFHGILGLTSITLMISFFTDFSCTVMLILDTVANFFIAAPSTIVVLVTLDRYLHIKYLLDYSLTFTPRRYRISLALVFVAILLQAGLTTVITTEFGDIKKGKVVMKSIGVILLTISCVLYLISYFRLRKLQKQGTTLSNSTKNITRIASLYLMLAIVVKVFPLITAVLVGVVTEYTNTEENVLVYVYINLFINSYTIFNACIFMFVNRLAKRYFIKHVQNIFTTIAIVPSGDEQDC